MKPTQPATKLVLVIGDPAKEHLEFELVCDFEAIAEAELLLDRSLIFNLRKRDIDAPTIQLVRALFYGQTRTHHPDLTMEEIRKIVTAENFHKVSAKVIEAWMLSMARPKKDESADPSPAGDGARGKSGSASGATPGSTSA